MPNVVWTPDTLANLHLAAEQDFSTVYPCILDRLSLAITSGIEVYTLPDYVLSIKRVTYKGTKLDPMPYRIQRQVFQSATQQGKPFWYIFNNVGLNKINLFPIPNESLTMAAIGTLWTTSISTSFIIEYYRIADGINFTIPLYFRKRLLKLYVSKNVFAIESRGQKLKNTNYYNEKWEAFAQLYSGLLDELHNKPRKLIISGGIGGGYFPGRPLLPIDKFGIGVDAGE